MLQINVQPYASDALEDAMRLAQTKALNSFSFSDCINYLNYAWMDMYQTLAMMDEGYFSRTVQLTDRITKLPPFVKNTVRVYAAQDPVGFNRTIFRASGYTDLNASNTYHISGFDLYCPDAVRRRVWLNYVPMQPQIFFTHHNRDPKLYDSYNSTSSYTYNLYTLVNAGGVWYMVHRNPQIGEQVDITNTLKQHEDWDIVYITCDYPYVFVTYKNSITSEYRSGFYHDILNSSEFVEYNPFAFTGRPSNVEYLSCKWNDKTGMGVVVRDHNDEGRIKELGWTPDTLLVYPCPEMYRLLVARLADKFAAINESNVMGVSRELVEAEFAFKKFVGKDKSAWHRIDNVNGPNLSDLL